MQTDGHLPNIEERHTSVLPLRDQSGPVQVDAEQI